MNERTILKSTIKAIALLTSVLPSLICTLTYFPIWRDKGGATLLSGISLLLLILCAVPVFKLALRTLASPSAQGVWFVVFIAFFMLSKIADDVTVIAFIGFISNVVSAVLFKAADAIGKRGEK